MAENLTYHEKAYLLPRDDDWLAYVTQWLKLKQTNAEVRAIFARHLGDN